MVSSSLVLLISIWLGAVLQHQNGRMKSFRRSLSSLGGSSGGFIARKAAIYPMAFWLFAFTRRNYASHASYSHDEQASTHVHIYRSLFFFFGCELACSGLAYRLKAVDTDLQPNKTSHHTPKSFVVFQRGVRWSLVFFFFKPYLVGRSKFVFRRACIFKEGERSGAAFMVNGDRRHFFLCGFSLGGVLSLLLSQRVSTSTSNSVWNRMKGRKIMPLVT